MASVYGVRDPLATCMERKTSVAGMVSVRSIVLDCGNGTKARALGVAVTPTATSRASWRTRAKAGRASRRSTSTSCWGCCCGCCCCCCGGPPCVRTSCYWRARRSPDARAPGEPPSALAPHQRQAPASEWKGATYGLGKPMPFSTALPPLSCCVKD